MYYRRLRDLREDHDMVQKEVAALLGIDQRVYSNYELGKREIPTRYVVRLADLYRTSTDYILGRTNIPYMAKTRRATMHTVDNAVIMAAGTSSRFAPLSYEMPKALITVRGEVLIERQIRQLQHAGVPEIYIVTGYKAEQFAYLKKKYGVHLVHNPDYLTRNNNASIWAVRDILKNTYICSADNYFTVNPFEREVDACYYAAVYADGPTKEWCMEVDDDDFIRHVEVGGSDAWFMLGHTFWDERFSRAFVNILAKEYDLPETADMLWESLYIKHIDELMMRIRRYRDDVVFEFDTLDELREFDDSYVDDTRSAILKEVARELGGSERDIREVTAYKDDTNAAAGFRFVYNGDKYYYSYNDKTLRRG